MTLKCWHLLNIGHRRTGMWSLSNYCEVEVVLPDDTAIVRLELEEKGTLAVGGVLWPNE
jgi:hypothetical protein